MSSKSSKFQPVARPSAAEIIGTAKAVGAFDSALPTTNERGGEGAGQPPSPPQPAQAPQIPAGAPSAPPAAQAAPQPAPARPTPAAAPAAAPAPAQERVKADPADEQVQFNNRISVKLDRQLTEAAKIHGSKKRAMCIALQAAGYDVPAIDLEDRGRRRY